MGPAIWEPAVWLDEKQIVELIERYPDMEEIVSFAGSIGEFYQRFAQPFLAPSEARREQLLTAVEASARKVFSEQDVQSISQALQTNYLVSTAEHHASLTYWQTFNVALNQFLIQRQHRLPLICLSCGTTTLDNELFPRGVFYKHEKLPFLTKSHRYYFALDAPSINKATYQGRVRELLKKSMISEQEATFLEQWLEGELAVLTRWETLSAQVSVLNQRLWTAMVHEDIRYPGCNYFMLPAEEVVEQILHADLRAEEKSWVYNALFNPQERAQLLQVLNGTRLCWDLATRKGTFLFWGYNAQRRPLQLFVEDTLLVSECGTIQIPLIPQAISAALRNRQIVPASSLCCLYLTFYCGLTLMGGILQVNYLGDIQRRLVEQNPLALRAFDLEVIRSRKINLYANFQGLPWNEGGLKKITDKFTPGDLMEYQHFDHLTQLHECLDYLAKV